MDINFTDKRNWLIMLIIKCPFEKSLPSCPVERYRGLSLKEKIKLVNEFTDEEVDSIIESHKMCLKTREE